MASNEIIELNAEMLQEMQVLGRGACAVVYKYGDNQVVKVLNESGMKLHNEEQFEQLLEIDSDICAFPQNRVEIDGHFQGYTMEFVDGLQLQEKIGEIDFDTLISAIKKSEQDIRSLAQDKVFFQDLNQGGIMWDEKSSSIKIIDTDFFEVNQDFEVEECFNANMTSFNTMIEMELGIMSGQAKGLAEYLHTNSQFSDAYREYMLASLMGTESSIVDLIQIARDVIQKEFGVVPKNLAEMRELVGEQEIEIPDVGNIPTFLTPEQQVGTSVLGKQVLEEMSDTPFTDETESEMESQELELQQQSSLEQVDIGEIDLNNSYFHFTKRDNLGRISREGLKPQIGGASKMKNEEHSRVYLSRGGKGIIEIKNSFIHEFKKLRVCDIPEEYRRYFDIKDYSSQEQVDEKAVYDAMEKRFKDEIYFQVDARDGEDFLIEDQYDGAFAEDFSKESLREMFEQHPERDIKGKANHTISPEQLTRLSTEKGDTAFDIVNYLYNRLLENAKKVGKEDSVKWANSDLNSFFEYIGQREMNSEERV